MVRPEPQQLLAEIDAYCASAGIAPATLTTRALNDGKTYERLRAGGQCLPRTMAKIRAYMAAHPASAAEKAPAPGNPEQNPRPARAPEAVAG